MYRSYVHWDLSPCIPGNHASTQRQRPGSQFSAMINTAIIDTFSWREGGETASLIFIRGKLISLIGRRSCWRHGHGCQQGCSQHWLLTCSTTNLRTLSLSSCVLTGLLRLHMLPSPRGFAPANYSAHETAQPQCYQGADSPGTEVANITGPGLSGIRGL